MRSCKYLSFSTDQYACTKQVVKLILFQQIKANEKLHIIQFPDECMHVPNKRCFSLWLVLTLSLFGRVPRPAAFSTLYMCPAALSDSVSVCVCVFVKSPQRILKTGTQKIERVTKNREKTHTGARDNF